MSRHACHQASQRAEPIHLHPWEQPPARPAQAGSRWHGENGSMQQLTTWSTCPHEKACCRADLPSIHSLITDPLDPSSHRPCAQHLPECRRCSVIFYYSCLSTLPLFLPPFPKVPGQPVSGGALGGVRKLRAHGLGTCMYNGTVPRVRLFDSRLHRFCFRPPGPGCVAGTFFQV